MRITRPFVLLALAALLAPRAEASRTSVWERNPPAALTLAKTTAAAALAPLAPAAEDDVSLAEAPRFNLGDVVLVKRELEHEDRFGLGPLALLGPTPLRGTPSSYPETRVRGLELLPPFRIGASPALSLWSRQPCGFSCLGLASDGPQDPWGLKTVVNPSIGPHDVFPQVDLESGNEAVDLWLLSPINNTLNVIGGIGNTAANLAGIGDDAIAGGLRAAGASEADIEFLRIYAVANPAQVAAAMKALGAGAAQGRAFFSRFLERLREAQAERRAMGAPHPERGAWVPGGARVRKGPYADRRPNTRRGTVRNAWDNAQPGTDPSARACPTCGKDVFGNPNTGELRNTPEGWDLEHVEKWEKIRRQLADRNATPEEYRDAYNDLNNTILRCRTCNRSDNKVGP